MSGLNLPDEDKLIRQEKIIDALMDRIERGSGFEASQFSIFQTALTLQNEVRNKTERLEETLHALGKTSQKLKSATQSKEQAQKNLSDALEMLDEGIALFSDKKLSSFNEHFKTLCPDIESKIITGLSLDDYITSLCISEFLIIDAKLNTKGMKKKLREAFEKPYSNFVVQFFKDQWYQFSSRRSPNGALLIRQTNISHVIRQNRLEKNKLIDEHMSFVQGAFDHLVLGIATFSDDWELQVHNQMFADLFMLPVELLQKGTALERILRFLHLKILDTNLFQSDALMNFAAPPSNPILVSRLDGTVLDIQFNPHPQGGHILNLRDISSQFKAAEKLRQLNETLEERVRARTNELRSTNEKLQLQYNELARADSEMRHAKEKAEQANASKTLFLATASHDLLQPINAAKLFISVLKEDIREEGPQSYIQKLDRTFTNIETLLRDLLDVSRLDTETVNLNLEEIEISDLLGDVCAGLQNLARAKGLRLRLHSFPAYVKSDRHYLGRIFQNLIVNAIQNTEQGGLLVGCRKRGSQILVEIWDSGIGIESKDFDAVFKEFTRLRSSKSSYNGMGLGLSIVKRACFHLGHEVELRSIPGKGTMFRVHLERTEISSAETAPKAALKAENSVDGLLVFLIENDPEVRDATTALLEKWGANVIDVGSTKDAIEQYYALGDPPDIILADFQLDHTDSGLETIRRLRNETGQAIPAIMITAHRSETLQSIARLFNFTILNKPINIEKLKELIHEKTIGAKKNVSN